MPKRMVVEPEQAIEGLYNIRGGDVWGWLRKRPYLVPLLVEGRQQALRIFGPGTEFALEVTDDPEIRNFHQLFALILTDLPDEEPAERLERFDEEWWLDASTASRGNLVFHIGFK